MTLSTIIATVADQLPGDGEETCGRFVDADGDTVNWSIEPASNDPGWFLTVQYFGDDGSIYHTYREKHLDAAELTGAASELRLIDDAGRLRHG